MILVVDDDEEIRATIRHALETLAYAVVEAPGGAEALALVDDPAIDVAILDYLMPGMDGIALAAEIRARRPGLPLVFASGYGDEARLRQSAGADVPILHKPFRIDELAELIAQFIDNAPASAGLCR